MRPLHYTAQESDFNDDMEATRLSPLRKAVVWVTLFSFAFQPLVATAQVVADSAAGANSPQVGTTANGLPIVQIVAPNGAGVSHNKYQQFNVDPQGLILNNSQGIVSTQQAGYVDGNPNLAGGAARIILNEVTSTNPSTLRGYTEVAGTKAEVIIANPNGITCNGCGFINTTRGVLATGTPVFGGSGSLDAFRVTGGQITIEGAGLNGINTDQIDLIARSVQVNGSLWANNLNVVTGANQVNYGDLGVQIIQGDANRPTVGIDVALLGGMYANKIRLVGTEAGVGVVSAGNLAAQAGDLVIDNQGQVTLTGNSNATGNVSITSGTGFSNSGTVYAGLNTTVVTSGQVLNTGTLAAKGNVTLTVDTVNSTGLLGAGLNSDGTLGTSGTLSINATSLLTAKGQNVAGGDVAMTGGSLDVFGSRTAANGNVALTATAGNIDHGSAVTTAGGTVTIVASGSVSNRQGDMESAGALVLDTAALDNSGGRIASLNTDGIRIRTTGQLINANNGFIGANGDVTINAGSITNSATISAASALTVSLSGLLDNSGGSLFADRLALSAVDLINRNGTIAQSGTGMTSIAITGTLDNTSGTIRSNSTDMTLAPATLTNDGGSIAHAGSGTLTVQTGNLSNIGGSIGTNGAATITADAVSNRGGSIASQQQARITSQGGIDNSGNGYIGADSLMLSAQGAFNNTSGTLEAAHGLSLNALSLTNSGGSLSNLLSGVLSVSLTQSFANTQGGFIGSNGSLDLTAGSVGNSGGSIYSKGSLTLRALGTLDNQSGLIQTDTDLGVTAQGALMNQFGRIEANGTHSVMTVAVASLDNSGGRIANSGDGKTTVGSATSLVNSNAANVSGMGIIGGNGDVEIDAVQLSNTQGGSILAGRDLSLAASGAIENTAGSLYAARNLTIAQTSATIQNASGKLSANGNLQIAASSLANQGGVVSAALDLGLTLSLTNGLTGSGKMLAGHNASLNLQGDYINIASNEIKANGDLSLVTTGSFINQGTLGAVGNLNVNAAAIDNQAGAVFNADTTTLTASGNLNNASRIEGNGINVNSATLSNTGTIIGDNLTLTVGSLTNTGATATIAGASSVNLYVSTLANQDGATVYSAGDTPPTPEGRALRPY